ncbi:MAG: hypothetical protein JNL30_09835 [Rubrivivax sp.]|nr:hypothetical protein [Rubrivivax sp.]
MPTAPAPHRRTLCLAALCAWAAPLAAQPALAFQLITPAEAQRDRDARPKDEPEARTRSLTRPGGSAKSGLAIRVVAPTQAGPVAAPFRIELAFDAPAGVKVVPSTFRVQYGVLKLDLTERLRRFATISETGVVVSNAAVPDGLHRLLLSVADEQGNVAEHELRVRVGVAS